ncbi:MAG: inorganic phosphate transporter, partial [Bacteroidales bacterium]|nr:inorganic phosphate transporter [Bacteroidales bacterium]
FMSDETKDYIRHNSLLIIGVSFLAWAFILQLLTWLTKINILKLIVLVGTFALAMAFAGNDLVNFIGVPLAGYESFKSFTSVQGVNPNEFLMADLAGKVKTPTFFLLIAGIIMVVTVWTSKKARTVSMTEIKLARQNSGSERFGSSIFARSIVRNTNNISKFFGKIFPDKIKVKIAKRFDQTEYQRKMESLGTDAPYFDQIRASVNLVVASILIAFATSLKLPLSTTYVTFMVAMGTSMSDRAWGRESAVYRITGVFSVIGGWFFTAFFAFTVAFIMAVLMYYGSFVAIFILVLIAAFVVFKTHVYHKKKYKESEKTESALPEIITGNKMTAQCAISVKEVITSAFTALDNTFKGLKSENYKLLKKTFKNVNEINVKTKKLKDNIIQTVNYLEEDSIETGHYYVQVVDYLREIAHSLNFIITPSLYHVDNNHKALLPVQFEELDELINLIKDITGLINDIIQKQDYKEVEKAIEIQQIALKQIAATRKNQIKRIKANEVGTRNSILYLDLLSEIKNLLLYCINLLKSHRDFVNYINGTPESQTPDWNAEEEQT